MSFFLWIDPERSACDGSAPRRGAARHRPAEGKQGHAPAAPALPVRKAGLGLLVKVSRYAPSSGVIRFSRTRSAESFAPTGYPHRKPVSRQKEPFGESPKKLRARGARNRVMPETPSRAIRSRERIKKGSSIGNRVWNHSSSPSEEAAAACTGASSKKASKIRLTVI